MKRFLTLVAATLALACGEPGATAPRMAEAPVAPEQLVLVANARGNVVTGVPAGWTIQHGLLEEETRIADRNRCAKVTDRDCRFVTILPPRQSGNRKAYEFSVEWTTPLSGGGAESYPPPDAVSYLVNTSRLPGRRGVGGVRTA